MTQVELFSSPSRPFAEGFAYEAEFLIADEERQLLEHIRTLRTSPVRLSPGI